jgi:DNA polymerase III subunit alpha
MAYTHLHVHTEFSVLDGASKIPKLLNMAKESGMEAIAITDHGNMFGAKLFHDLAKKAKIKPIIGCEMYVAKDSRTDKKDKYDKGFHLILLAKNKTGYKNLVKLVSLAWSEGFYYNPRIDWELIEKYHEGLIASSACIGGEIPKAIFNGNDALVEELILRFKKIFGEDFYLEMQRHKPEDPKIDDEVFRRQEMVNKRLIELSKQHNVKLIATNDVHFAAKEDAGAHDRLLCINTGSFVDDENRLRYTREEYLKTPEQMLEIFSDVPEAISNTQEIADKVEHYELNQSAIMPDFPLPDGFENENDYLKHLSFEGAKKRYGEITEEIQKRLDFELETVGKMGFPGYFLIVQDFIAAAREMDVSVGPGRGSAAGSVIAYALRITDIDPLKYGLLFERFLNPDRISMPDIDIDFDEDGRDKVLKWVVEKYGKKRVAHIVTFGKMAPRMAIRDVGRVQRYPLDKTDYMAKLVPERPGVNFESAYKDSPELEKIKNDGTEEQKAVLKNAENLEGTVRNTGVHACGVIICRDDIDEHVPTCTAKDADLSVTQYEGKQIESVGMLKMDFLGLKTLSIIKDAVENVKISHGKDIDIDSIPLDDEKTLNLYAKGDTTGLFQFESEGMKKYLKELKPDRFEDLIAMNALYRPGPMEYIPNFIRRKFGIEKIEYDLPEMEELLKETYGITVYQEQVMLLSRRIAGFSRGDADSLRKGMGKKIRSVLEALKPKFIEGGQKNGHAQEVLEKIWKDWLSFAEYAFNKSHSTCYAYISYQTAYLKAHYPAEYMAAVLSRNLSDIKKTSFFLDECRNMGIKVLPPDTNESRSKFTVNNEGNIRFGMGAIKGVGDAAVMSIVLEREENGNFTGIFDFLRRINLRTVNKKAIEAMAYAGTFDNFKEINRAAFFQGDNDGGTFVELLLRYAHGFQDDKNSSQQSLFGESSDAMQIMEPKIPECEEWGQLERLKKEYAVVGIYLSGHPLDDYKIEIDNFTNTDLRELKDNPARFLNNDFRIAGILTKISVKLTKKGDSYCSFVLEDYNDNFTFFLFQNDYLKHHKMLKEDTFYHITGRVKKFLDKDRNQEFFRYNLSSAQLLSTSFNDFATKATLFLEQKEITDDFVQTLKNNIEQHAGNIHLYIDIVDKENLSKSKLKSMKYRVNRDFILQYKDICKLR